MTAKEKVLRWNSTARRTLLGSIVIQGHGESDWVTIGASWEEVAKGSAIVEKNAAESLPAQPEQKKLTDVFEIYGAKARSQGWDFLVCKTLKEALEVIEGDLDELNADPDEEDEVRIVFRRYTESQMEDVIYE